MYKDPTEFRARFKAYKEGKMPYENGLPRYAPGKIPETVDDATLDFIINHEGFKPNAWIKDPVTGKMLLGSGIDVNKYKELFRKTGKWSAEDNRRAVRDIVIGNRPTIRRIFGDKYNSLTPAQKGVIDDIAFNIGAGALANSSPKFVAAVLSGNMEEAKRQMDWGNHLARGLVNRNKDRLTWWDGMSLTPVEVPAYIARPQQQQLPPVVPELKPYLFPYETQQLIKPLSLFNSTIMSMPSSRRLPNDLLWSLVFDDEPKQDDGLLYAKNGKLPCFAIGKGDGMKYSWDDQKQEWNRYTGDEYGDVFADFVVTPRGGAHKKDIKPVKIVTPEQEAFVAQNQPIIKLDDDLFLRNRISEESNKRTWRSDVADALHAVGEGAMIASTFAAPEVEPLVYPAYKTITNAVKNRAAAAIYRNIVPASYSESYMPYGKLEEVANAAADFLSPFKKLELTNEKWYPWLNEKMPKGFITDAVAARDEIYRKYLGLPNKDFYYIKNADGTLSHNLKNHHWRDVLKQIDSAEYNDPTLSGINTNSFDLINSAGGEINQSIKLISPNNAMFLYSDVWDVNPFLSPDKMGNILPTRLIKKYTHFDKNNKLVWNKDIPKYIEKLKTFELSDLTNGRPQPVKTNIDVLLLDRNKYMYDRKMSDSEIIDKMAKHDFDIQAELIEDWDDLLFKQVKNSSFQRSMLAFLKNPDKFRGIFNTPEPYSDQELYDMYGHFLRRYKNGKSPIHIKPANRGKLTRLKARTGKSESELYNDGNPAHKKMVVFARNARKWSH